MNPTTACPPADNERRTPVEIVETARRVLGRIDLDPASDADANRLVRATNYYDETDNGLDQNWYYKVFLNPPGGKVRLPGDKRDSSKAAIWWAKLLSEVEKGNTTEAIFVCFNLEAMLNTQQFGLVPVQAFPYCVPRKRLAYPSSGTGKSKSPPGASAIVYLGASPDRFKDEFSKFGYITEGLTTGGFKDLCANQ
jgi:hypothetical protein